MDDQLEVLLNRFNAGELGALDDLFVKLSPNLKVLARMYLRGGRRGINLQSTVLLHELFIKLRNSVSRKALDYRNVNHLLARLALQLRNIVRESARAGLARKRDPGGSVLSVAEGEILDEAFSRFEDLYNALDLLQREDERAYLVFVYRNQVGLSSEETAELLGISSATLFRDLEFARSFLKTRVSQPKPLSQNRFVANPNQPER
jgi:RNA polymerase sigma factor (TIGR02999 family)